MEARIKILIVNRFFSPQSFGGATIVVEKLAHKFASLGHEVLVLTAHEDSIIKKSEKILSYSVGQVKVVSIKLEGLTNRTEFSNPDFDFYSVRVLKSFSPDVVNTHAIQGIGIGVVRAAHELNIPVYLSLHDPWFLCDRQFMIDYQGQHCNQKVINVEVCRYCAKEPSNLDSRISQSLEVIRKSKAVISPSDWFSDFLRMNLGDRVNIVTISNGVNQPLANQNLSQQNRDKVTFGYLGGIGPVKGSDILFRALEMSLDIEFNLIFVNNAGSLGLTLRLEGLSEELRKRITIIPSFSQENMEAFYGEIDCLLFPSQTMETFGLTVREAIVRKKWVISTECGGPSEVIIENENGNLIPIGSASTPLFSDVIRNYVNRKPKFSDLRIVSNVENQVNSMLNLFLS